MDVGISVRCSSGTYIRAIARDLGEVLGVGGHLTALRRTAVGQIGLDEATPLPVFEDRGEVELLSMAAVAARFFPTVSVDEAGARDVGFGRALEIELPEEGPVAVLGPDGSFLALYERREDGPARAVAVFI